MRHAVILFQYYWTHTQFSRGQLIKYSLEWVELLCLLCYFVSFQPIEFVDVWVWASSYIVYLHHLWNDLVWNAVQAISQIHISIRTSLLQSSFCVELNYIFTIKKNRPNQTQLILHVEHQDVERSAAEFCALSILQ